MCVEEVVIFGHSDFSCLMGAYLQHDPRYKLLGYTVSKDFCREESAFGQEPIFPFEHLRECLPQNKFRILLTVGYKNMNKNRRTIWQQVRDHGYEFISYISDDATVEADSIGEGNIILPGCVIQPFVTIGNFNIFESGCVICHHSVIDDFYYTYMMMLLSKKIAEVSDNDLSRVKYSPATKVLYKYKGQM